MIVQSGNDATIALAERVAGTEETFVQMMNANAKRLGMDGTHFDNSSGLPAPAALHDRARYVAARDRHDSRFSAVLQLVSRCANSNTTTSSSRTATACWRRDPSVDGLKTGHTDSAGYCLVTSSLRDGMRLVSVVLGSTSMKSRENASACAAELRLYLLRHQARSSRAATKLRIDRVWKAARSPVDVGAHG